MLTKFTLRNYKNFKDDITIDFRDTAGYQFNSDCITDGVIGKMLIYGRNATGKTNLGRALGDIYYLVCGEIWHRDEAAYLNADATEDSAAFSYTFQFEEHEILYRYERYANLGLKIEELTIDERLIYRCDFFHGDYKLDNLQYVEVEDSGANRYLETLPKDQEGAEQRREYQLPLLRWMINNVALKSDSLLLRLSDYVSGMIMMAVSHSLLRSPRYIDSEWFMSLKDLNAMQDFEEFLNAMGIGCKLALKQLPDGQRELYFVHDKLIPFFENASSGTLALVELYRRVIGAGRGATLLYLDEFDAFYHYEMADHIIRYFKKKYPKCQIIMTTHNTNLMTNRLMRPDCLFILSTEGKLTALCNATQRELREGHNLEKMYISGEFEKYE